MIALLAPAVARGQTATSQLLHQDVLIDADMWSRKPQMLAAGLGFTNIIGVPGIGTDDLAASEQTVRSVGGTWNTISCAPGETPALSAYTSASTPQQVAFSFGAPITTADGLPVEFSWPVRPSTLDASDFRVTFNTGETVTPSLAAVFPNAEYNERSTVVLFGKFGDRFGTYPVRTEVVGPLQLVGEHGRRVSALGMHASTSTTPYDQGASTGPHLTGAKLTKMSARGDNAPAPFRAALPNDGVTLYGSQAQYRLRVFTTGGFSPDGVRAVFPTDYSRFFRIHARGRGGRDMVLARTGRTYSVDGHRVRVVGLADLGRRQSSYDDCYTEDKDNQIDIVLAGDRAGMERITSVEIPASGAYDPFFNPGGPGNAPTPGVPYTRPGPRQNQKVLIALDDPLQVTFVRR